MKPPLPAPTKEWHNDTYAAIDPSRPELSARSKKIVVTGGGYGIGRGVVEAFAIAGASSIAILGRKEQPLLDTKDAIESKYKATVSTHIADVTDVAVLSKAASDIGTWDVLVMNAGYMSNPGPSMESDVNEWWKAFEVNIKGSFITAQAFLPTKGENAVVVATSTAGVNLPASMVTNVSSYVASKLGLIKFIEVLAAEHPDVRFTTIHPGTVETNMFTKSGMLDLPTDKVELPAHYIVWVSSPEAEFLKGKFSSCNWDVDELKANATRVAEGALFTTAIDGASSLL
ncbi:Short chain dehydrogenase [Pleurostoma richardsiae]|uniref:Short chain dehydrogenase n=1 Tax=Pleurostoma richardsiae TaxID=41990 RepID=A0AA38VTR5_9PEZI|nr:Short chain dehydrogenase [Pleurostoma richardsiae]